MQLTDIAIRKVSKGPMKTLSEVMVTRVAGLNGDFRGKPGKRQVTILSQEQWDITCTEIEADLPWTTRRANLLVSGVSFNKDMVGKLIKIGSLILIITRETDPCPRMDQQYLGLTQALIPNWRGGICCQVIADGRVKIGDEIQIVG
ncbi:MOSC domain-containing protein [uncultured Paraglaciecola sp.]|uniref:MOSC domain-containing protein n=1 Tax=uncultured Paraglaciecola sp. TaxID=1765024 RepID=UPI00259888C8|nr:MOSC domain-containing protein [uncultured Paraglaciecola sp.]